MDRLLARQQKAARRKELPQFRYIADSTLPFRRDEEGVPCACCGELTHEVYEHGFDGNDFEGALCPACVAGGRACQTFDASFHEVDQCEKVGSRLAVEELEHRTPRLETFQAIQWPACCNDFCALLREMTVEDFENEELMAELADDLAAREISEESMAELHALLFYCPTCGKHRAFFDVD